MDLSAIASIIAAVGAVLSALLSQRNAGHIRDIHVQINSRMDELMRVGQQSARAEGRLEGKEEQRISEKGD